MQNEAFSQKNIYLQNTKERKAAPPSLPSPLLCRSLWSVTQYWMSVSKNLLKSKDMTQHLVHQSINIGKGLQKGDPQTGVENRKIQPFFLLYISLKVV